MIFVKPTDIAESSIQHGKDLRCYETTFEFLCTTSKISSNNMYQCNYSTTNEIVKKVKEKIDINTEEDAR